VPIPPTFLTVVEFWNDKDFYQMLSELELNIPKILHGEQEYQYLGQICAGDTISGKAEVVAAIQKKDMVFITIETVFVNQFQEPVLKGRSTLIERQ
jgi:acyl dehydratase